MERQTSNQPIPTVRSVRRDEWRGLTSCRAGVIVPVAFFPLLREDAIRGGVQIQVRMAEALRTILNPIRVKASAYLVPKVALSRFEGSMETLNSSYEKVATLPGGAATPPWFVQDSLAAHGNDDKGHEIYDRLGVHYLSTSVMNTDLVESYWRIVNHRRKVTSEALPSLPENGTALAPAFWNSLKFNAIKPSFDAAMMEGTVPISVDAATRIIKSSPVSGQPGTTPGLEPTPANLNLRADTAGQFMAVDADGTRGWLSLVTEEMGGSISLANIAMATKSLTFAKMRERYSNVPDEYLVELLMKGIRVPPEDLREPILLGESVGIIGQVERYATDGASLDQSVTRGMTMLRVPFSTPAINTGGMVLVTIEIVPEQLYERVQDGFLRSIDSEALPDYLRDYLDPQKVEVVPNRYADSFHSDGEGVFGYAPLNFGWMRSFARVGGRYKRPVPDTFVEDRQRIWKVEKTDPELAEDFYVCPQPFPHDVFADADADPFEVICVGQTAISGLTVFGAGFEEDGDHYEKIIAQVDTGRIDETGAPVVAEANEPVVETSEEAQNA